MASDKPTGLLEKVKEKLNAAKAYRDSCGRKQARERLYRKLGGKYYADADTQDGSDRIKVENVAGIVYQTRPNYHFRRPHITVSARTPKYRTDLGGKEMFLDNIRNSGIMEVAMNQEIAKIHLDEEVNAMIQDWLCPYEFGALKIGYGEKTQYSDYDSDKCDSDGVWAIRTCPDDILVDSQARGKRSLTHYFTAIHRPVQWIKDNKDFNPKARQNVAADARPEFLKDRLTKVEMANSYDMGTIYEYHDLINNQIGILASNANEWLIDPYEFPYIYRGPQYVFLIPMPMNNDFYGRCFSSLAEPQFDEENAYRTRMLSIFKRYPVVNFYNTGSVTADQKRQWKDATDSDWIEVNNKDQIETRTMPNLPSDMWNGIELAQRDGERVLGTSAMRRGEVAAVKPTTAQIIEGHGNLRDADIREEVAKVYKEACLKLGDLMIQFYDTPRWVKLTGKEMPQDLPFEETNKGIFALYSREDIAGNYDMDPDVTSMVPVNNETKAQVMMEIFKLVPTMPQDVQQEFHRKTDMNAAIYEIAKMQGLDLHKFDREEENPQDSDPNHENEIVLAGGLLHDPKPEEKQMMHLEVHRKALQLLAVNPSDPRFVELARHNRMHEVILSQQQPQMSQMPGAQPQPQMGQVAPIGQPGQGNLPPVPGGIPPLAGGGPQLPQVFGGMNVRRP